MPLTVGIDLGTSTSEIAYVKDGIPVLIPNSEGDVVTPSVVHIGENGEIIVGEEAAQLSFTRPDCTFMEVKRMFGTDTVFVAHGKSYSPEKIQSYLIKYLVNCAEEYLGKKINSAVITVPAYFTDIQRRQTIKAGELAGLTIKRVINEPTAAALDYGLQNLDQCENILVYDFGGGTLDVTVLELFEGVIDVKSSNGNNHLGGKDLDEVLAKLIAGDNYRKIKEDPRASLRLRQAAIDCKIALGVSNEHQVGLPFLTPSVSIDCVITREQFEGAIASLIDSTKTQMNNALNDAKIESSELQKVLLVGGTTRIPLVHRTVSEHLNTDSVTSDFPELTVARGAAIQAAIIDGVISEKDTIVLTDVCPFTLGAKILSMNGLYVDPLIKRNTTIPYEFSKLYRAMHEYQDVVDIPVYQGESKSPHENTYLGEVRLSGLPQRRGELAEIEVTFSYDINGILHVTASATGNNKSNSITIDMSSTRLEQPVKLSEWEKAPKAKKYRPLIRKVMKIVDEYIGTPDFIDTTLYIALEFVDSLKSALIREKENEIETLSDTLKRFLEEWENRDEDMDDYPFDMSDSINETQMEKMFDELSKLFKNRRRGGN